jgi:KaiC/GvpD/RAD55 family RecA-like ATPase
LTARLFADARDDGISFILQSPDYYRILQSPDYYPLNQGHIEGGLLREQNQGHFVTIAGRGGTGKSLLALQFLTDLLNRADPTTGVGKDNPVNGQQPESRAFYFTLEASPLELARQLKDFDFGKNRYFQDPASEDVLRNILPEAPVWKNRGLHIQAIPSPVEDLTVLIHLVRQTIATALAEAPFNELVGIAIDPLGGVRNRESLRTDLRSLKLLADSHKTFLFLLAEDHIYEERRSIEHYSQTVLQLRHDPSSPPFRWIFVQKARSQPFRAGNHQLELRTSGVAVFPSVEAQSSYAHELSGSKKPKDKESGKHPARRGQTAASETRIQTGRFLKEKIFTHLTEMPPGSVIFLMGPPGTFKQNIASDFATAEQCSSLYISFKAESSAVQDKLPNAQDKLPNAKDKLPNAKVEVCPVSNLPPRLRNKAGNGNNRGAKPTVWFIDARNPLSTPQEILSKVRIAMTSSLGGPPIRRAVVWGLRRLADMPNFSGSTAVQFLEALVTLLRAEKTTCLLVDWPDIEKGNTLPIVDLSNYILLTRLCYSRGYLEGKGYASTADAIWNPKGQPQNEHAALLRIQRDGEGFHRTVGYKFFKRSPDSGPDLKQEQSGFETLWNEGAIEWEKDPGLS